MKFLGRAKKFLQDLGTESPSRAQTFNLACASGHRVRGERTEGYQALRCPSCGEGVFVLPRSPLPEPEVPAGMVGARAASGRARSPWADEGPIELTDPVHGLAGPDEGAEIVWDDEPGDAPAPATPRLSPEELAAAEIEEARRGQAAEDRGRPREPGRRDEAGARRPTRPHAPGRDDEGAEPVRDAVPPAEGRPARPRGRRPEAKAPGPVVIEARPRDRRGPRVGLIFATLALLILATIGWRAWRSRQAQYPLIAERGRVEGIPALEAGDFDRAYQLLSQARSAVASLGGAVEGADEIRQAADEAEVFNDLCPDSLEELLDQAGRKSPEEWEADFDKLYKGRYYLFDSYIIEVPGPGGGYELGYKVFPPGEARRFGEGGLPRPDRYARIDLAGFDLFEIARPERGHRVTFGAKLQWMGYDSDQKQWMVRLEPKSGVYITHPGALQASGWPAPGEAVLPGEDQP